MLHGDYITSIGWTQADAVAGFRSVECSPAEVWICCRWHAPIWHVESVSKSLAFTESFR